jgi:hypothetical protein
MDKKEKNNHLLNGMIIQFKKTKNIDEHENLRLFNNILGLKFKQIRLDKKITAEAVVEDNKKVLKTVNGLYKFELGKISAWKLWALSNYYKFNVDNFFKQLN